MTSGTTENLMGIWGANSADVYAVGFYGTALHFDGTTWSRMETNTSEHLNAVFGVDNETIYAAGNEVILRYSSQEGKWNKIETNVSSVFWQDLWAGPSGDFFFVGINGEILSYIASEGQTTSTTTVPGGQTSTTTTINGGPATTTSTIPLNPPSAPVNPYPADGETGVNLTATLQWSFDDSGDDPLTYDVYFDNETGTKLAVTDTSTLFYTPERLSPRTTYYWKIVSKNTFGEETEGPLWSFTTGSKKICAYSYLVEDAEKLNKARNIRDRYLSGSFAGRKIISLYYNISPGMISFLECHPKIRRIIKEQLN